MKNTPPFPVKNVKNKTLRKILLPVSDYIRGLLPDLKRKLKYIEVYNPKEYMLVGLANSFFMGFITLGILLSLTLLGEINQTIITLSIVSPVAMFIITLFYWIGYPGVQANKRAEQVEKDLLFAIRDMSIQMESGVGFVEALETLSTGYGKLSEEFDYILKEINTGSSIEDSLEESITRNASHLYRSVMIRLLDGIKTGADIPDLLSAVIHNLDQDLQDKVKKYGQEVNTWITLYLVMGIVLPSMGLTIFIMLSSFSGISITWKFLVLIGSGIVFFHISALGLLNSRRPAIEV